MFHLSMDQSIIVSVSIIINAIGLIQAWSLVVSLCLGKPRKQLNFLFALLLFCLGVVIANTIFILMNFNTIVDVFQYLANGFTFLLGPTLWLVAKRSVNNQRLSTKEWPHLIPFILYLIFSGIALIMIWYNLGNENLLSFIDRQIMFWGWNVQFGIYLFKAYGHLKTNILQDDGRWIKWIVASFIFIYLLNLSFWIVDNWLFTIPDTIRLNITVLISFIVVTIVYRSQSSPIKIAAQSHSIEPSHLEQLTHLFERDKIHLSRELTIKDLSERLGISPKHASYLINSQFKKNFNEFVNEYRVKEVLSMIARDEQRQLTIMGMAKEAGFHSNTAFYRAFKSYTGTTPKKYMLKS